MFTGYGIAAVLPTTARGVRRWLMGFGGLGLIPLGLLDNSPVPIPGAMDVAAILLAARQPQFWLYYAAMATVGSLVGGYVTYRVSRKGGKAALERKFSRAKVDRVTKIFDRWGFGAIAIPALLPPPMPIVPFLFAAGAMQYPPRKFMSALAIGRTIRYLILAYLGARYGRQIITIVEKHGHPLAVGIVLVLLATAAVFYYFWQDAKKKNKNLKMKLGKRAA